MSGRTSKKSGMSLQRQIAARLRSGLLISDSDFTLLQSLRLRDGNYQSRWRRKHRAQVLIRHAKRRSTAKGLPFDLDRHVREIQARIDAGRCEMTGMPFDLLVPRARTSPSLHRVHPNKGYVYENVRVICFGMNAALGNWGEEALLQMVRWWERQRAT